MTATKRAATLLSALTLLTLTLVGTAPVTGHPIGVGVSSCDGSPGDSCEAECGPGGILTVLGEGRDPGTVSASCGGVTATCSWAANQECVAHATITSGTFDTLTCTSEGDRGYVYCAYGVQTHI